MNFGGWIKGQEVDYLVGDHAAIEVKAASRVSPKHLRGLEALIEEGVFKKYYLVTQDPLTLQKGKITCLFWKDFLEKLWSDKILGG